ncbi:MAG: hypothetical protein ACI8TQ_001203 [Planctomycetota bacterium]|jgi:hypothetical protein
MRFAQIKNVGRLTHRHGLKLWNHHFNHKAAMRFKEHSGIAKAVDLSVLRSEIHDRVVNVIHERKFFIDNRRREVADCYWNIGSSLFCLELGNHRL